MSDQRANRMVHDHDKYLYNNNDFGTKGVVWSAIFDSHPCQQNSFCRNDWIVANEAHGFWLIYISLCIADCVN